MFSVLVTVLTSLSPAFLALSFSSRSSKLLRQILLSAAKRQSQFRIMPPSVDAFELLDGNKIPWLAYGNGTGDADKFFEQIGPEAIKHFRHIDTAQASASSDDFRFGLRRLNSRCSNDAGLSRGASRNSHRQSFVTREDPASRHVSYHKTSVAM